MTDNYEWISGISREDRNLGSFAISLYRSGGSEFAIWPDGTVVMGPGNTKNFILDPAGNLTTAGTINGSSDKNMKENFSTIDATEILSHIASLPISTWNYKADNDTIRHIGPMAQDFYSTFKLGMDEKHISFMDASAIAIVGVQALHKELLKKDKMIDSLTQKVDELQIIQARLQLLEDTVNRLAMTKHSNATVATIIKK